MEQIGRIAKSGAQRSRIAPDARLQRHHPHPEHRLVTDIDIVLARESQLAVTANTEHRQASGYCVYRLTVPHVYRQIVLRYQEAPARIDVKGARVDRKSTRLNSSHT